MVRASLVSTHSIRCRILKARQQPMPMPSTGRFNPFDPMQDTERIGAMGGTMSGSCFNPFDPMQDTESYLDHQLRQLLHVFQPIRSDAGY